MLKRIITLLGIVLILFSGIWINNKYNSFREKKSKEQSEVLLEGIRKVTKLIAVEGFFSEIYDYKDYYGMDFPFFRKKALIRVKAKVSVGYDFEKVKITLDHNAKTVTIGPIGKAQILSVDHNIDYYDISEGTFNSFTVEDYNQLNKNAKDYIINKVKKSELMQQAEDQKDTIIQMLKTLIENNGWQIIVQNEALLK